MQLISSRAPGGACSPTTNLRHPAQLGVLAAATVVFSLLASTALAVEIVLIEDNRSTTRMGQNCWEFPEYDCDPAFSNTWEPPSPFADMDVPGQTSSVGILLMAGNGGGSAYSDVGWYESNSYFDPRRGLAPDASLFDDARTWTLHQNAAYTSYAPARSFSSEIESSEILGAESRGDPAPLVPRDAGRIRDLVSSANSTYMMGVDSG